VWQVQRPLASFKIGILVKKHQYPVNNYQHYHAHLYFEHSSFELASNLAQKASDNFDLKVGRLHQKKLDLTQDGAVNYPLVTLNLNSLFPGWIKIVRD
jgi:DOPA 4,5-dioxygenase